MKNILKILVLIVFSVGVTQCKAKREPQDSSVKEYDSSADPLREHFGLRVNLTTNVATFFENGTAIKSWPVSTTRNDGRAFTRGTFRFDEMTTCLKAFNSDRTGDGPLPCSRENPMGYRALWFLSGAWGIIGLDSSMHPSIANQDAEGRRTTTGSVLSDKKDIDWLTDKVSSLYGTSSAELEKLVSNRKEASFTPTNLGLALEFGHWPTDIAIGSSNTSKAP